VEEMMKNGDYFFEAPIGIYHKTVTPTNRGLLAKIQV